MISANIHVILKQIVHTQQKWILYIGGFNLPDKNAAAQRVISNAKIFRALGYQVCLIGLGNTEELLEYEGFWCYNLKYPKSLWEWFEYLCSINHLRSLIEDFSPTIILAYNYPARALEKLRVYCKRRGIKLIADSTEWYTPEGSPIFKLIKGWDTQRRMKVVQPKLDGVISISHFLYEYYCSRGTKSIQLPPLVDIEETKWSGGLHRNANKIGFLHLIYAGSPGHKDWLDVLVKAIVKQNNVRPVKFTIIGLDEEQFKNPYSFKDAIPQCVRFMGRIPHKEVMAELFASDFQIFVRKDNLTTRAGFPTKFVESISAGLPVITNLTSNIGDYLTDGKNGYVLDVSTEESLTETFGEILNKTDEEINLVKQSIDRTTFDYRRYIIQIKDFLDNIE